MKNLYYTTAFLLATATTANAIIPDQQTPVISENPVTIERESSGGVDALAIFGVLLGIVVANELSKRTTPPVNEPRPQVRPQTCMDKHGVFVVCPDE